LSEKANPLKRVSMTLTTKAICERVSGRLDGPAELVISGVEHIDRATSGQITFIGNARYAERWLASRASAALVEGELPVALDSGRSLIRVKSTDLALAMVLEMFAPPLPVPAAGIEARAVVDPTAQVGQGVAVGAQAYIGPRARIGDGSVVHPNVTVMDDCVVGAGCVLWPGVVMRERCEIGEGCILHPNAVIGADGFGYRPAPDGRSLVKIPHIGRVVLGRAVEIGAGTCVDRGKFSETAIGDGSKIDNLCQIGHNCRIGRCVVIAGLVGIGGSVTIGDGAMIGGGSIIKDHVKIGAGVRLAGHSGVMEDIPDGASWFGFVAQDARAALREVAAVRKLPKLLHRLGGKGAQSGGTSDEE
jgi:UDP-3-O-[3-hydroxymyristoyl] glucosamine N-acyltransferase